MSREFETELPTPKSKSSTSAIFEAFKNLTGGNKTRRSTPTPQPAGAQSGHVNKSPEAPSPQHVRETLKRLQSEPQRGSHAAAEKYARSAGVIGGPSELQNAVDRLRSDNAVSIRIQAAKDVAKLLARYPVQDVDTIWATARDMLDVTDALEAVDAAYELLFACVEYKTLIARERITFLEAIIGDERPETLASRIRILNALTSSAKYLDHLEISIAPLVGNLLAQSYIAAAAARKKKLEDLCIKQIFEYTLSLLKFNASALSRPDLSALIERVLSICKRTSAKSDITGSIDIIDAVVTYSLLPEPQIEDCLEVLCGVYYQIETHQKLAYATVRKVVYSHLAPWASEALFRLVRNEAASETPAPARGAALLITELLSSSKDTSTSSLTLARFLSALTRSTVLENARVVMIVLQMLSAYTEDGGRIQSLFEAGVWPDVNKVLTECSRRQEILIPKPFPDSEVATSKSAVHVNDLDEVSELSSPLIRIIHRLLLQCQDEDFDDQRAVMDLVTDLNIASQLDDNDAQVLIEYYNREYLLLPPAEDWLQNCRRFQIALFNDQQRTASVRLLCLDSLREAYGTAEALDLSTAKDLCLDMMKNISHESDGTVLKSLCSTAVEIATSIADEGLFFSILQGLEAGLPQVISQDTHPGRPQSHDTMLVDDAPLSNTDDKDNMTIVVTSIVQLLLRNLQRSIWKTTALFESLLRIAESPAIPAEARIVAFKALARLRADVRFSIFIIDDPGCESLAAGLCRTRQTDKQNNVANLDTPSQRLSRQEEQNPRRKNQSAPAAAPFRPISSTRSVSGVFKLAQPAVSPTWMYGGMKGLPEAPPSSSSRLLFSHLEIPSAVSESLFHDTCSRGLLKVSLWLELQISLLQQKDLDWEIFSYIIVHLGAQVTNHLLFVDAIPQIKLLRSVLCNQLTSKSFCEPPASTNLKKGDVAMCLFDILTMLISYREHFARSEQEEMVKVFASGIGTWERTSECCIHALLICCLELPMSVTKVLDVILQKLTQIITQAHVAVHVLEFLTGLARLPELFLNFREAEYHKVFALCFKYLQFVRDQRKKTAALNHNRTSKNYASQQRVSREVALHLDTTNSTKSLADELPQYVYALAYHVMTFFFMSLRIKFRAHYMSFIVQNLTYRNEEGKEVMEEQSEVLLDFMQRIAFSDRTETSLDPHFAKPADGVVIKKTWVVGTEILTVETAARTGVSQLTRRRPSGTKYSILHSQLVDAPRHQVPSTYGSAAEAYYSEGYIGITPEDIVQEMHLPISDFPVLLPDDPQTQRSIDAFDRISALDGHKIGIIYVGEGQTSPATILANVMGSEDYTSFLNGIGTLTELKNARFNTQGLDKESDGDGKFTFCWRNRVTEMVFHVTTMMPTNIKDDPQCNMKFKHTGNDFVNIIFNNSGIPFNFDTFPSDFNYVNIVIVPEARASFVETRLRAAECRRRAANSSDESASYFPNDETATSEQRERQRQTTHESISTELFYKVTVHVKEGMPAISPAAETKIISAKSLPTFVRMLALNASVFSQVWARKETGETVSSWCSRLREIRRLRERHAVNASIPTISPVDKDVQSKRESRIVSPVLSAASPATTPMTLNWLQESQTTSPTTRDSAISGMGERGGATGASSNGGALRLLRNMSQAAFMGDPSMGFESVSAGSGTGGSDRERESSVGSRASTRDG